MNMINAKNDAIITVATIGNAIELIAAVMKDISGTDISTGINGENMTGEVLATVIASEIRKEMEL